MDHDAMGKHVQTLLAFKKRIEDLLNGAGDGASSTGEYLTARVEATDHKVTELGNDLHELEQHVSSLQASNDRPLADRLGNLLTWFEANQGGLEALLTLGEPDEAKQPVQGASEAPAAQGDQSAPTSGTAPDGAAPATAAPSEAEAPKS